MTGPLAAAWTPTRDIPTGAVIHWQGQNRVVLGKRAGTLDPTMVAGMREAGTEPIAGDVFTVYLPGEALYARGAALLPVVAVPRRVG